MLGKAQMDRRVYEKVSADLPVTREMTTRVINAFLQELKESIVLTGGCELKGVGKITLRFEQSTAHHVGNPKVTGAVRVRLYFTKANELKRAIQDHYRLKDAELERTVEKNEGMNKYAVDEGGSDSETLEKAAASGCPRCGAAVQRHGNVLSCPRCGTEPFERKTK
jgi:nucleoid DNA-binding protein/ribosomal protein S27AE